LAETFLGEDLLAWLVLAIGAALVVGNGLALLRPPEVRAEGALERAPLTRSAIQILIGALAAAWSVATLITT
jgi:hypothetical protein